jgi:hypothetical protein
MKKTSYPEFLDAVAGDHVPNDLDLAPTIIARIRKGKRLRMQPKAKLVSTILLVAIVFAILFFTVPAVKAAIQSWFGYVPDVGLVQEGQIRVLTGPVSVTREGITVTVDQVVLNQERTILIYSVDGIPAAAQDTPADEAICSTGSHPYMVSLRLQEGNPLLASPEGVDAWSSGYRHRFNYPPVPMNVNDATLVISCLFHTVTGTVPEVWEIPLQFVSAPPDMTAFPVIDIPTSTAPAATPTFVIGDTALSLTLDRAVQMDDGYLLYATIHWKETPFKYVDLLEGAETLRLLDASGQEMLYELHQDEQTGINWDQRQTVFAIKTAPVQTTGPLTLQLDAVLAGIPVNDSFIFDPGPDPKPGQQWQPNVKFTFGEYRMLVRSITVEQTGDGYSIEMTSDTGILTSGLIDLEHSIVTGYDGISAQGVFYNGFYYRDGLPDGPVTLSVGDISVKHIQKLQAQWTPPAISNKPLPTQPSTCLTSQTWQASLSQPRAIPTGLPNRVLTYGPIDQSNINGPWEAAIVNLDGSQRQPVAEEKGTISPDGTKFAYSLNRAEIQIKDVVSGNSISLPGTANSYPDLFWTPDGRSIVFSQIGTFDLFMINQDGSGLRQLTFGGYQEIPLGWLADGSLLYGQYEAEDQYTVYRFDLQSGASEEFSHEDIQSISPDGRYLAIGKLTFGERWQITISDVEGQNRWSLNDGNPSILFPRWSPDGQWVIVAVLKPEGGAMHALIDLRTCQAIVLPQLQDDVLAWLP